MEDKIFRLILSTEADEFLLSLPEKVADKIRYNIRRVQKGERDPELFKKLGDTEIWEFRTLYNKMAYRLFFILGHREGNTGNCHSWHS